MLIDQVQRQAYSKVSPDRDISPVLFAAANCESVSTYAGKRSPTLDLRQTESGVFTGVAAVSPDRAVAGPENPLSIPTRILDFVCDSRLVVLREEV